MDSAISSWKAYLSSYPFPKPASKPTVKTLLSNISKVASSEASGKTNVDDFPSLLKQSSSRRTIARCHALGKLMQKAMGTKAFYAIEFLEIFEKMPIKEQDKVIIHELMHIPKSFGGGFRHHDFVCERNVDILYERYENVKRGIRQF